MSDRSVRYTPEFKRQMVELVSAGRTPASLAKEFGPTAWTISTWAKQDARNAGKGDGGLTSTEREELAKLRRENRRFSQKPRPGLQPKGAARSALRIREGEPGHPFGGADVPGIEDLEKRVLRVVWASDEPTCTDGPVVDGQDRGDSPPLARVMRSAGLRGASLRRFVVTTTADPGASRAVDLGWAGAFTRKGQIGSGWLISPTSQRGRGFCIWRWCWMCTRDAP